MNNVFYVVLFFYSLILSDLTVLPIIRIGGVNIYAVDIVNILICLSLVFTIRNFMLTMGKVEKIFIGFLIFLFLQVFRGIFMYGFSGIGEARILMPLLMSFVPFILIKGDTVRRSEIICLIEKIIYIAGIAGLFMFIIEYLHGGRFFLVAENIENFDFMEDPRGIRYLDVYHIYNMILLLVFIILKAEYTKSIDSKTILLAILLVIAIFLSQGRTSIIALIFAYGFIQALRGKIRFILYSLLFGATIFIIFIYLAPQTASIYLTLLTDYRSVIEPVIDYTGTGFWRWALNVAAIEQGMNTFWLGQGFGGYYYFIVPLVSTVPIEVGPHNMYIIMFLKAGIIGVMLLCLFLFSFMAKLIKQQVILLRSGDKERSFYLSVILLVLISQIPYGMSYSFIQLLGLYIGFGFILLRNEEKYSLSIAE
jgi:hypothetical protein